MLQLAPAALCAIVILFVPGYLLLRAFCVDRAWSVALAPASSIAITSLMGEALAFVGLPGNPITVVAIPCLAFLVITLARGRKTDGLTLPALNPLHLALYAAMAFAVALVVIVLPTGWPENYFAGGIDLVQHFNSVQAFVDSGVLSSIKQSYYLTQPAIDPIPTHSFYPSGWHVVCALTVMITGAKVTVVFNGVNLVVCCIVWSFGACALFTYLFKDKPYAALLGALVAPASSIFPWGFYIFGPIFSNLLSFTFVPTLIVLFMQVVAEGIKRAERGTALALFVISLVGVAFSQPNAAFTAAVFLIPYLTWRILGLKGAVLKEGARPVPAYASRLLAGLFLLLCAGIWVGMLYLPLMRGIVSYVWDYTTPVFDAILNALAFSHVYDFAWVAAQPVLGVFALVGAVYAVLDKRYRWAPWTALLGQALCVICLTTEPPIKNYFSGFWYTDPWRMAALAIICTLPLVLLGLVCFAELIEKLILRIRAKGAGREASEGADVAHPHTQTAIYQQISVGIAALIFGVSVYWGCLVSAEAPEDGGYIVPIAEQSWTCLRRTVAETYGLDAPYSDAEEDFASKVKEITGGSLLLNDPYDGSVVAYGLSDLNVYWRYYYRYFGKAPETDTSVYLRLNIADVASDPEVQRLCRELGIEYVVRFSRHEFFGIFCRDWDGINQFASILSIDEDTPGFELVLEDNGMQLYRITALDE